MVRLFLRGLRHLHGRTEGKERMGQDSGMDHSSSLPRSMSKYLDPQAPFPTMYYYTVSVSSDHMRMQSVYAIVPNA